MNKMVNNNIHLIGQTLSQLSSKNKLIADNIISFIMLLSEEHMNNFIDNTKMKDNFINYDNLNINDKLLSIEYYIQYYKTIFSVLNAYIMDAYVLASMFLNDSEEVITYTGAAHTEVYHLFFQNYLNQTPIYESENIDNKCITFNKLYNYIDVNKYRDIV
jgi:hypothetical protein